MKKTRTIYRKDPLTSCMAILLTALLLSGCGVQMEKAKHFSKSKGRLLRRRQCGSPKPHKAAGRTGSWNWFWDLTDKAKKNRRTL